ncbi:hypothetical protein BFJ71_g14052 [Fusarium oxysporum]|nr:hypothetical protein BFJ71_g14052 [Fusarium oxysporum]
MEVAGLVIGIVGLYSACQSCYDLYSKAKDSAKEASLAANELEIHKSILKSWASYWEFNPHLVRAEESEEERKIIGKKMEQYIERYPEKAIGIVRALKCIGDALSDRKKLLDIYGLEVNLDDVDIVEEIIPSEQRMLIWKQLKADVGRRTQSFRSRMAMSRKFAWALRDGEKFEKLIGELKKHNDSLYRLSPEGAFEILQLGLVLDYLPRQDDTTLFQWKQRLSSLREKSKDASGQGSGDPANTKDNSEIGVEREDMGQESVSVSPSQQGVQVLADLADIRVKAAENTQLKSLSREQESKMLSFRPDDLKMGPCGMAVWSVGRETVFIEQHSYKSDNYELSRQIRANIFKLGRLLQLPVCTKRLHMLQLLGMVEFLNTEAIGLVYRLPNSLGKHKMGFPIDDMNIRKPRAALVKREEDPEPNLGWRFDLARKLVQNVLFLHASGWLHKNIRLEELYFFPKSNTCLSREWDGMDFDRPFLLGYKYARPDDVQTPQQEPHDDKANFPRSSSHGGGTPELPTNSDSHKEPTSPVAHGPKKDGNEVSNSEESAVDENVQLPVDSSLDSGRNGREDDRYETRFQEYIRLDEKHHPSKRKEPKRLYCHAFDMYALGIALLEIGLWMPISHVLPSGRLYYEDEDPFETRRMLIRSASRNLPFLCGALYTRVTVMCLSVDPEDSGTGLEEQRALCTKVAIDLAQCQA